MTFEEFHALVPGDVIESRTGGKRVVVMHPLHIKADRLVTVTIDDKGKLQWCYRHLTYTLVNKHKQSTQIEVAQALGIEPKASL